MVGDKKLNTNSTPLVVGRSLSSLYTTLDAVGRVVRFEKDGMLLLGTLRPIFLLCMRILFPGNTFGVVRTLASVVCFFYSSCGSCSGAQYSSKRVKTQRAEPNVLLLTILVFWSLATCSMAWPVGPVSLHSAPATPPTALPLYSFLSFSRASPVRGGQICCERALFHKRARAVFVKRMLF